MTPQTCRHCRHFTDQAADIERLVPGLRILSSAYSAVRADNGICLRHDEIRRPAPACADFEAASPQMPR